MGRGFGTRAGTRLKFRGIHTVRNTRFWIAAVAFQVCFGLAVFAIARQYYRAAPAGMSAESVNLLRSLPQWPEPFAGNGPPPAGVPSSGPATSPDPATVAQSAEEAFSSGQYGRAAALYEQLLAFDPKNVETHNNLGLTLHYLGRSAEALRRLEEGAALDPAHQRIWLTTGFVNAQLGNASQARIALGKAQVGSDEDVRKAAVEMLAGLQPRP